MFATGQHATEACRLLEQTFRCTLAHLKIEELLALWRSGWLTPCLSRHGLTESRSAMNTMDAGTCSSVSVMWQGYTHRSTRYLGLVSESV